MKSRIKELYAKILEDQREVMFYDDDWVYTINEPSNEGWNVEVYTMSDQYSSDAGAEVYELKFADGGLCTGDAYDAIEFMMPTQLIDMDRASPQQRKAHT